MGLIYRGEYANPELVELEFEALDAKLLKNGNGVSDNYDYNVTINNYLDSDEVEAFGILNVKAYGAIGDGITDDTAAVVLALAAVPSAGGCVYFPAGTYLVSNVDVTGIDAQIIGSGASSVISCVGHANGAFYKTDHDKALTLRDLKFTGVSPAITLAITPTTNTYVDFKLDGLTFDMDATSYAVSIVGAREGFLSRCVFSGGKGLYFQNTVSPFLSHCIFMGESYANTAIFYDGKGDGYDAGLVIRDCEIMGWDKGVDVRYCDWLYISGSTIDYNASGAILLYSQEGATILGNYLGTHTAAPAITLAQGVLGVAPDYCSKIDIHSNHIAGHYTAANTYDNILVSDAGCDQIAIRDNYLTFYTRYGVNFSTAAIITIDRNTFVPASGHGVSPIYNALGSGDSGVKIRDNTFPVSASFAGSGIALAILRDNVNYNTSVQYAYTVASPTDTSFTIPHYLATTPDYVQVTAAGAVERPLWVTAVDATNVTVATDARYGDLWIYLDARKVRGT